MVLAGVATCAMAVWTYPSSKSPPRAGIERYAIEYMPGGAGCLAQALDRLPQSPEKDTRLIECAKAKHDHTVAIANLAEQQRATSTSELQAELAMQQVRLSWIQTVGGIITLFAAIFAAWYAGKAAFEARRSANLAQESLKEARKVARAQLRPYVSITTYEKPDNKPLSRDSVFSFRVQNFGQIPATDVRLRFQDHQAIEPARNVSVPIGNKIGSFGLLAPNDYRDEKIHARDLPLGDLADILSGRFRLLIRIRVDYDWDDGTDAHDLTLILRDPTTSDFCLYDPQQHGT